MNKLDGKRVKVNRILVDRPLMGEHELILEAAPRDPSRREPCGAVGRVGITLSDGIVSVHFGHRSDAGYDGICSAFAHPDDLEETTAEFTWPSNKGLP